MIPFDLRKTESALVIRSSLFLSALSKRMKSPLDYFSKYLKLLSCITTEESRVVFQKSFSFKGISFSRPEELPFRSKVILG